MDGNVYNRLNKANDSSLYFAKQLASFFNSLAKNAISFGFVGKVVAIISALKSQTLISFYVHFVARLVRKPTAAIICRPVARISAQ